MFRKMMFLGGWKFRQVRDLYSEGVLKPLRYSHPRCYFFFCETEFTLSFSLQTTWIIR